MTGAELRQQMLDGGAPRGQVEQWEQNLRRQMLEGGAPVDQIGDYFGDPKPTDTKPIVDVVTSNFETMDEEQSTKAAEGWAENFEAGLQVSSGGLLLGGKPDLKQPIDASLWEKTLFSTGMMLGDLPANVAGFVLGVGTGGAVAGPPGAIIGAGAASLALPAAIREVLMGYYNNPDGPKTWKEFGEEFARVQWEIATQAVIGGTAAPGGALVGGAVKTGTKAFIGETGSKLVGSAANATTFATTAALMDAGFRGQVPSAEDFLVGAVLAIGFSTAGTVVGATKRFIPNERALAVAANLRSIYARTGLKPQEILVKAREDVVLQGEILAPLDEHGNPRTPTVDAMAPKEPPPKNEYQPEVNGKTIEKLTEPPPETAPPAEKAAVAEFNTQLDGWVDGMRRLENTAGFAKARGMKVEDVVSHAGAIGEMQIMPGTARQYGYDPARLFEPEYNRMVGRTIIADLAKRYKGDFAAMAVAYNAGPGRANQWIKSGRDMSVLPKETRDYLSRAEAMGLTNTDFNWKLVESQYRMAAPKDVPGNNFRPPLRSYESFLKGDRVVKVGPDITGFAPAPEAVAGYMQRFGELAGFTFMVGPGVSKGYADIPYNAPMMRTFTVRDPKGNLPRDAQGNVVNKMREVYVPETRDEVSRRWHGLGQAEILHHEAGHAIDASLNPNGRPTPNSKRFSPELTKEMEEASRGFRPSFWVKGSGQQQHVLTPPELIADAIATWISNPSFRSKMPKFGEIYSELLEPYVKAAEQALPKRTGKGWEPPPGADEGPSFDVPGGKGPGGSNPGGGGGGNWVPPSKGLPPPDPQKPRKVTTDVMSMNEDMLVADILDIIKPSEGLIPPDYLNPQKIIAQFDLALTPARQLDKFLKVKPEMYGIEDIMRNTLASRERAGYFVRYGTLDAITLDRTSNDSFVAAFKMVKEAGGTQEGFEAYRLAQRTLELEGRGIVSGVDLEVARRYTTMRSVRAKYEAGSKIIQKVKDASIDYAVDSGRFSPELATAMKTLNQYHIVLRRIMEPDYNPPMTGAWFGGRRAAPRKIKGSELQIADTLPADIDNLHTIISIADHNRAVGAVISVIEAHNKTNPNQKLIAFERIGERAIEDFTLDPTDFFDATGKKIDLPPEPKKAAEVFLAMRRRPGWLGPDDFVYYRQGQMEIWRAKDPTLAALMRQSWPGRVNPFAQAMIQVAKLVRLGVISAPDFVARTTAMSMLAAPVAGKGAGKVPFADLTKGAIEAFGGAEIFKDFQAKGGLGAALTDMDVNHIQRDVAAIFEATGTHNRAWGVLKHPIDAMRTLNQLADASARLGMFKRQVAQGVDPRKAAMMTRKAYLDFAEPFTHQWVQTWSRMAAFMSVGWKELHQIKERLGESKADIAKIAMIGAGVMMVPTIINYALNMVADEHLPEGQKYHDLPRWMRDTYWVFPPVNGVRMKLKRPFAPAVPFALLPERMMDWALTNEPKFADFISSIMAMSLPPFMPNVAAPVADDMADWFFSTGRPMMPASMEKNTGYMQYTPDTTETSKAITKALGPAGIDIMDASPITLDNYIKQWTGTLPMTLLKAMEGMTVKEIERPRQWADTPFLGSFFVRNLPGGQRVSDFYDRLDSVTEASADFRKVLKEGGDVSALRSETMIKAAIRLREITEALRTQRLAVDWINRDKKLTDDEKMKQTDKIGTAMAVTAKGGLAVLDEVEARLRPAVTPFGPGFETLTPPSR